MKNNSLHYAIIYGGILVIAAVFTSTLRKHQCDAPQPTQAERNITAEEDSLKFRSIRRAQAGEVDYIFPDSAFKK